MARVFIAALLAVALGSGCANAPPADQLFSPSKLSSLVADRTLSIRASPTVPEGMLLYLARDGTGWFQEPSYPPKPGRMSMVFDWRVVNGSRVCLWATPTVGDIPNFIPAFQTCIQVLRVPHGLKAVFAQAGQLATGPIALYPFNAFTPQAITEYLEQVRVLYGGTIPVWTIPEPAYAWR
jgi:hypothetical protein